MWVSRRGRERAGGQRGLWQSPGTEGLRDFQFEEYCTSSEGEQNIACRGGNRQ